MNAFLPFDKMEYNRLEILSLIVNDAPPDIGTWTQSIWNIYRMNCDKYLYSYISIGKSKFQLGVEFTLRPWYIKYTKARWN